VISFISYDKAISSLLTRKVLTQVRWMFFEVNVILGRVNPDHVGIFLYYYFVEKKYFLSRYSGNE
jgi:hypothetical protein